MTAHTRRTEAEMRKAMMRELAVYAAQESAFSAALRRLAVIPRDRGQQLRRRGELEMHSTIGDSMSQMSRIQSITYQGEGITEGSARVVLTGHPDFERVTLTVRRGGVWDYARAGSHVILNADLILCRVCDGVQETFNDT